MTYSWHNVSPDYQSNIISYHNGTEYKKIEFLNECYDYTELSDYIKETLSTNSDLEPDQASPIFTHKSTVARTVMCRQDGRGRFPVLLDDHSKCRTNSQRKIVT